MDSLVFVSLLLGSLQVTSYQSIVSQTDSSPFYTSTGERVNANGIAVSQDYLRDKVVSYGDVVYVEHIGFKVVNDCLGKFKRYSIPTKDGKKRVFKRQNKCFDVWVASYAQEKAFDKKFRNRKLKVWLIKKSTMEKYTLAMKWKK